MVQSKSFLMRSEQDFTQRSKGNKALGNLCVFAPWRSLREIKKLNRIPERTNE